MNENTRGKTLSLTRLDTDSWVESDSIIHLALVYYCSDNWHGLCDQIDKKKSEVSVGKENCLQSIELKPK